MPVHNIEGVLETMRFEIGIRSQREVAEQIGVSEQFLSLVLSGKKAPSQKVLSAFGYTKHTLYIKREGKTCQSCGQAFPNHWAGCYETRKEGK